MSDKPDHSFSKYVALQEKRNQTTLIKRRSVKKVLHENDKQLLILSIQKVLSEP